MCVCVQYAVEPAPPLYLSVSELSLALLSGCWSSLAPGSLLPDGGSGLTSAEINAALAWSFSRRDGSSLR